MDRTRAAAERGFTLIEIVVTVAIVAATVAAGIGVSLASRSFAVSAAAAEFDHVLDGARTVARETQGATLAFAPDAYGDGTEVRVLAPAPDGTLAPTTMPVMHTRAAIEESQALGAAPFALVIHASGALGGRPGFRAGDASPPAEVGCPPSGSFHFVIRTAGASADRFIPCRITLAATGPVTQTSWPPAVIAPPPTPCSAGPCAPQTLPTPPSWNPPVCPPNYAASANGCAPAPPSPSYHVTASPASSTMTVNGAEDTLTARADLQTQIAGAPPTLPVIVQSSTPAICTTTPPGPQLSGTTFTLKALSAGTCTLVVSADTSAITGATADTATLTIPISSTAPTSPPTTCDLVENGKCYHRIDSGSQRFEKYVIPDIGCATVDGTPTCSYVDSIKTISLYPGYGVQPPVPPTDSEHELLFRIDEIFSVEDQCQPYPAFSTIPVENPIDWHGSSVGGPAKFVVGFGEPSIFLTSNHILLAPAPYGIFDVTGQPWTQANTFDELYTDVALQLVGTIFEFKYSAPDASVGSVVLWHPDFAGCDTARDATASHEYGIATVYLIFEIYQAVQ